jgi:hypothetical protein
MTGEPPGKPRLINRNPYLYGPGPVFRRPTGFLSYYGNLPPAKGFTAAALTGMVIALTGSMCLKIFYCDPRAKAIEDYYKENPPQ